MEPDVFWEEPSFDADDSAGGFVGRPPPGSHKCAAGTSHPPPPPSPSSLRTMMPTIVPSTHLCQSQMPAEQLMNKTAPRIKSCLLMLSHSF